MLEVPETIQTGLTLEEALTWLRGLVEASRVEAARAYVREVEAAWPDDARVRHWARVLAPPRVLGTRPASGRPRDREYDWIRDHAHEYPGCWLALDGDRLVAADPSVRRVREQVAREMADDPLLYFQPRPPE